MKLLDLSEFFFVQISVLHKTVSPKLLIIFTTTVWLVM